MASVGAYYLIPADYFDALAERVAQLEAKVSETSFAWGSAQDYRAAGTLPEKQVFVVVDSVENLNALAQEQNGTETSHAFLLFVGSGETP